MLLQHNILAFCQHYCPFEILDSPKFCCTRLVVGREGWGGGGGGGGGGGVGAKKSLLQLHPKAASFFLFFG